MEQTHSTAAQVTATVKKAEQTALEEWDRYRKAKDLGHENYMARAKKADAFYRGEQWDPADKAALDKQGKPALTINQILPTINALLGEQVTRRADMRYKAAKGGTEEIATVLTKLVNQILDENSFDDLESEVFADGLIEERGYYDIRVEFDENLEGSVTIDVEDPRDIVPDPNAKRYDPSTWQEVTKTRWYSLDEIEAEFGTAQRKRVEGIGLNERTQGPDSFRYENSFADEESREGNPEWWASDPAKRQVRSVRVLERQFYMNDQVYYFVDPATGDKKKVPPHWNREKRRSFASQFNLFLHRKTEKRVRWRKCADRVMLHDEWSPYRSFTIVPYFPYFRRGKTVGVVSNLISPQELLNKLSSQELHIVNSTANSGWVTEKGSITNMTTEELAAKGAETGLVIEKAPGAPSPEKIMSNHIPTGLDRIGMKASMNIREISGVNDGMLGLTSPEVSGVALESKRASGQVQMAVPLENLARTRRLVAAKILDLVQSFYTEARVINITRDLPKPGESEQEELMINMPSPEGFVVNDITQGKYNVAVSSQPSRDTYNDTQFAEAVNLREIGVAIPDDRLVEYSNLEKKHELAQEIRDLTGRGEQSPEEQAMAAMIQQMELQTMQLSLMKLEGEALKLRAEAQKLAMEAQAIPEELQIKLAEIESQVQIEREGFEVRARLALEQSQNALEKIALQGRHKQTEQMLSALMAPRSPHQ